MASSFLPLAPLARRTSLAGLLVVLLAAWPAWAQPWPRFRGPNGEGVGLSDRIPERFTLADCDWRVELPGTGYSSPVAWGGGQVFVTGAREEDGTQFVLCLGASDGREIWKREYPSKTYSKHAFNSYASSTPALDAERVYITWSTPDEQLLAALDQKDGKELWRIDLGPYPSQHGSGASPIVFDGFVILPIENDGESRIVACDAHTGKIRWQSPRRTEKTAFSTPCLFQIDEYGPIQLIVASWAHGISSLNPNTGGAYWEFPAFRNRVVASPLPAGGLIFGSCGEGGVGKQFLAVRPGDPTTGRTPELAYEITGSLPYVTTTVAHGNLLFLWFDKGVVTCIDIPTGEIHWRERIGGEYFGSPVRVGDRLFCISRAGELVVLAAAKEFQELFRVDLGERSHSTPAVADGVLYLRTVSHLMALGGKGADQP